MNNYSWNLSEETKKNDDEFIVHKATGKAHLSAHWTSADQKAYNKKYYQENKEKWKKAIREKTNWLTGDEDQAKIAEIDKKGYNQDKLQEIRRNNISTEDAQKNQRAVDNYYTKLDKYYKNINDLADQRKAVKEHYDKHTLEGRIKSGNTVFNKAANAISDKASDTKENITGTRHKKTMDDAKRDYESANERYGEDDWYTKKTKQRYEEAEDAYNKTGAGRMKRLRKAGQDAINAIIGK